jgi:hypothetical protein
MRRAEVVAGTWAAANVHVNAVASDSAMNAQRRRPVCVMVPSSIGQRSSRHNENLRRRGRPNAGIPAPATPRAPTLHNCLEKPGAAAIFRVLAAGTALAMLTGCRRLHSRPHASPGAPDDSLGK